MLSRLWCTGILHGKWLQLQWGRNRAKCAEEAELLAAELALDCAKDLGYQAIILEGDALEVIKLIKNDRIANWNLLSIVENCSFFRPCFNSVRSTYAPRNCNMPAHELAQWAQTHTVKERAGSSLSSF